MADIGNLVQKYIVLRDKKDSIRNSVKEKLEKIEQVLTVVEAALLAEFQAQGVNSMSTPNGTAYQTTRTSCKVGDWDAVLDFIKTNDAYEFLDKRVNKTAVAEYREANNDLPPGVSWVEDLTIQVRRS